MAHHDDIYEKEKSITDPRIKASVTVNGKLIRSHTLTCRGDIDLDTVRIIARGLLVEVFESWIDAEEIQYIADRLAEEDQ